MLLYDPTHNVKRLFAGDRGSYLHGDSWRLSSEIVEIESGESTIVFRTYTGSSYIVEKASEGALSAYHMRVIQSALDEGRLQAINVEDEPDATV